MILKIVQEEIPAVAVCADGKTQGVRVRRIDLRRPFRKYGLHMAECFCKSPAEGMDGFQTLIRFADLTEFTKRCLVVIGDFRTLRLIHKSPVFSFRIGTALKHIISEEVAAGRQLDISRGVNTLIGENKAVVVGAGHRRG